MSNEKPYMNFSPGESLVPAEASSEYLEAFYQRRGEMEGCEIPMPFDEDTFLIIGAVEEMKHGFDFFIIQANQSLDLKTLVQDIGTQGNRINLLAPICLVYFDRAICFAIQGSDVSMIAWIRQGWIVLMGITLLVFELEIAGRI